MLFLVVCLSDAPEVERNSAPTPNAKVPLATINSIALATSVASRRQRPTSDSSLMRTLQARRTKTPSPIVSGKQLRPLVPLGKWMLRDLFHEWSTSKLLIGVLIAVGAFLLKYFAQIVVLIYRLIRAIVLFWYRLIRSAGEHISHFVNSYAVIAVHTRPDKAPGDAKKLVNLIFWVITSIILVLYGYVALIYTRR
jgi:hypothetical protein